MTVWLRWTRSLWHHVRVGTGRTMCGVELTFLGVPEVVHRRPYRGVCRSCA